MQQSIFGILFLVFVPSSFSGVSGQQGDCSSMSVRLRTFHLKTMCNITTLKEKQLKEIQGATTTVYLPVLYLLAFIVGLPSNLLALWILLFHTKPLPSTMLLINLTVADCLVLLALPFRIVYHFRGNHWELGEPVCRAVMAVFYGNMYGCVLCLTLVALDRYIAVVHPFRAQMLRSRRTSLYMTAGVWLAVLAAMLPLLVSQQTYVLEELRITTCHDALPEDEQNRYFLTYFATLFVLCFLLPFMVMLFCHGAILHTLLVQRQRYSHALWVTVLVLLVFILCLLPSNILLLLTYRDSSLDGNGEELYVPYMLSLAFSTYNSCIDPFIFYFVSADFRDKVSRALRCHSNVGDDHTSDKNNVWYSSSRRKMQLKATSAASEATPSHGGISGQPEDK